MARIFTGGDPVKESFEAGKRKVVMVEEKERVVEEVNG